MKNSDKVLIIGGTGFIGQQLVQLLSQNQFNYVTIQRQITSAKPNYLGADLFDTESILKIISNFQPNIIVNLAWETSNVNYKDSNINWKYSNAEIKIFENLSAESISNYMSLGSCTELGFFLPKASSRTCRPNPQDNYSKAKFFTYEAIKKINLEKNFKLTWIRPFQVYGKNQYKNKLFPNLIESLETGKYLKIKNGDAILDWVTNIDVSSAIFFLMRNKFEGVYDVGTGIGTSIYDVVDLLRGKIKKLIKFNIEFEEVNEKTKIHLVLDSLNCDIFQLGWYPKYFLQNYIEEILNAKKN